MFCQNCGAKINDKAVVCVKCGATTLSFVTKSPPMAEREEWQNVFVLCVTVGCFGVHRFHTKNMEIAWLQLTLGLVSCLIISTIWAIVDTILLLTGKYRTGDGRLLTRP